MSEAEREISLKEILEQKLIYREDESNELYEMWYDMLEPTVEFSRVIDAIVATLDKCDLIKKPITPLKDILLQRLTYHQGEENPLYNKWYYLLEATSKMSEVIDLIVETIGESPSA